MSTEADMILDGKIVPRRFVLKPALTGEDVVEPAADTAIPWAQWQARAAAGADLTGLGVILEGDTDIRELQTHLDLLPFVALHVPKFTDGRCYSHARRLRALWGYKGTLLVFGDVLRDQLAYMARVGINAFYMRADQNLQGSLEAFSLYTDYYQYD